MIHFLKKKGKKNKVIFSLCGDIWGYEIELFNFFHEKEILLEPESNFYINDISPSHNDVTNIHCKIFGTNLILNDNNFESNSIIDKTNIEKYVIKFELYAKIKDENNIVSGL